jgi:hypothetical protein
MKNTRHLLTLGLVLLLLLSTILVLLHEKSTAQVESTPVEARTPTSDSAGLPAPQAAPVLSNLLPSVTAVGVLLLMVFVWLRRLNASTAEEASL